ncbi:hypothetical protein [Zhihengliuella flava]|uniref:Uncharacterized protein n=1 Tax=Zhihengliuella flava TaxID=1285193 RepID=A0A931D3F7_9MICC|nr:hypothetical protein [Zhihengliuella flava]MBG6083684.1 hypothetical protein [Zhihengliuella flava]
MKIRDSGDDGQTIILIIGYVVIALLAISAMLAATAVNLEARRLQSEADSVADAAAHGSGLGSVTATVLTTSVVRARSEQHLVRSGAAGRYENLELERATLSDSGTTVLIRLEATVSPPIIGWFVPDGIGIGVDASARPSIDQ